MKKQIITLAVAALLLSSCGIYTKYERPEVKTDGLYGQDIEVEDAASSNRALISVTKSFFRPPTPMAFLIVSGQDIPDTMSCLHY